jgi:hypothetical protein
MASSLNGTGVTFNDGTQLNTNSVNVQTFNSTGTWTKPSGGQTMARVQIWGGGGGGSRNGGGGGGAYQEVTVPLSQLNTQTATVTVCDSTDVSWGS